MSRSHHERVSATAGGATSTEDVFLAGRLFAGAFLAALRAGAFLAGRLFAGAFLAALRAGAFLVVFLAGRLLAIVSPFDFIGGIYRLIMAHDRCSC
jgi:hypothetical protein